MAANPFLKLPYTSNFVSEALESQGVTGLRTIIKDARRIVAIVTHPDINSKDSGYFSLVNEAIDHMESLDDIELVQAANEFVSLGNPSVRAAMWSSLESAGRALPPEDVSDKQDLRRLRHLYDLLSHSGYNRLWNKRSATLPLDCCFLSNCVVLDSEFCYFVGTDSRTRRIRALKPDNTVSGIGIDEITAMFQQTVAIQARIYNKPLWQPEAVDSEEGYFSLGQDRGLFDPGKSSFHMVGAIAPGLSLSKRKGYPIGNYRVSLSPEQFLTESSKFKPTLARGDRMVLVSHAAPEARSKTHNPRTRYEVIISLPVLDIAGPYAVNKNSVSGPLIPPPQTKALQLRLPFKLSRTTPGATGET